MKNRPPVGPIVETTMSSESPSDDSEGFENPLRAISQKDSEHAKYNTLIIMRSKCMVGRVTKAEEVGLWIIRPGKRHDGCTEKPTKSAAGGWNSLRPFVPPPYDSVQ